ncbi:unnamed protein product, partial [Ectocarpus sp. 13 AM-2016]
DRRIGRVDLSAVRARVRRRVPLGEQEMCLHFLPRLRSVYEGKRYLEVFSGYLKDAGSRGFGMAYFWAAPPRQGGSYLFNVRPESMPTLNDDRLVKWYTNGLISAREQGFIKSFGSLSETIAGEPSGVIGRLPYLPRFLWPPKAESLIAEELEIHAAQVDGGVVESSLTPRVGAKSE